MKGLRAVVFDLDGTLCDSLPDIGQALNGTLVAAGLAPLDRAVVATMVGGGAGTLIERALRHHGQAHGAVRINALLDDFLVRYRARPCAKTVLYEGAREVLEGLQARGLKLGICTNKPADLTDLVLDALGIRPLFGSVVAASKALPPKPAPDMLLAVLAGLAVPPQCALMVGDSAADLGVARAAGVACILLEHGYSAEPVRSLGADAVYPDFNSLKAALERAVA